MVSLPSPFLLFVVLIISLSLSFFLSLSRPDSLSRSGKRKPASATTLCPTPESVAQPPANRTFLSIDHDFVALIRRPVSQARFRNYCGPRGSRLNLNHLERSVSRIRKLWSRG